MTADASGGPRSASSLRIALSVYRGNPYCGGQGVYVRHLSSALRDLGHEVTVFSGRPYPELASGIELVKLPSLDLYRDADPFRRPALRELGSGSDLLELATMWTGGFPEPRTFSRRLAAELRRRGGEFDLLHDDQSLGAALLAVANSGLPVVGSVHHPVTIDRDLELASTEQARRRASLRRWYGFAAMQARVARALPKVLTVSSVAKRDIAEQMGVASERIDVVPVGVDPTVWCPDPTVLRVPGRIMTTASADVALKGLGVLLEALAKLRTEREDAHLVVVGRPRKDGPTLELIERLGLEAAVSFVTGESDAALALRYASAEVAVVPSRYEGFSLPAIEAMACGVPLVVTDGGALPEVVGRPGECAVVVPAGDASALGQAIGELLAARERAARLGERGRRRALERYSWAATARSTVASYRATLEAGRRC